MVVLILFIHLNQGSYFNYLVKKNNKKIQIKNKKKMSTNQEKKNKMSQTDEDQFVTENSVIDCFLPHKFETFLSENFSGEAKYLKKIHYEFAQKLMSKLPLGYMSLDSGYPWFCYWITNILEMTKDKYDLSYDTKLKFVEILKELQHPDGGFCGMPKGYSHLISTYFHMQNGTLMTGIFLPTQALYSL